MKFISRNDLNVHLSDY